MGRISERRRRLDRGQSQRRRVLGSFAVGVVGAFVSAWFAPWQLALLVGWDLVAITVLARVWLRVGPLTSAQTAMLATREDDSRTSAELLLIGASVASLAGAAVALVAASRNDAVREGVFTTAAVLTVVLSWAVVHTVFALRYAHEYYTPPVGGIDFKSADYEPDYQDFAYVAFTIGMTFQVSDTDLGSRTIRRTALRHALLSYLFGAVILAMLVNVVAALLNR